MSMVPEFKWAEDNEKLYLTVDLGSAEDAKVELKEDHITFNAKKDDKTYALDFGLFKKIKTDASSWAPKARGVEFLLVKQEEGWWNRLLADKNAYKGRCKIDWDLWKDEDEASEPFKGGADFGMPDFGSMMGGMGGMGGMPGMGGMGGMPGMGGMGGMGGMDFASMMKGMGGMGGMPDMEGGDSDDEELPGLDNEEEPAEEDKPSA